MPIYFEDLSVGQTYTTPRRTITTADIIQFAGVSGDFNPLHTDDLFAVKSGYRGRIAHGPMLVGMAFGLMSRVGLLEGTALALLGIEWTFKGIVSPEDTIHVRINVAGARSSRKPDRGVVDLDIEIVNQRSEIVQTGHAKVLVRKRET